MNLSLQLLTIIKQNFTAPLFNTSTNTKFEIVIDKRQTNNF